MNFDVVILY